MRRAMRWISGLGVAGFVVGSYGLWDRLVNGHTSASYGSYVPWGLWVAQYIYFIGLSAGAFLLSTLVYVFNVRRLEKVGKLALLTALVTLFGAMFSIWLDLGHPARAWKLLLQTNFGSVMGWMLWFYTAYFILLLAEFWLAMRGDLAARASTNRLARFLIFGRTETTEESLNKDRKLLRILGSIGVPLAVAFHGGVGALFGVVGSRPFWNSGLTPITFLVGALLSGGALLTFLVAVLGPDRGSEEHRGLVILLGRIVLGLLAFDLLLEFAEYSITFYASIPAHVDALRLVLFGDFWWTFWLVHLALGVVIPAVLLVFQRRSVFAIGAAAALVAFTFLSVRLNIVIPALAIPELEGLETAFTGPGLNFAYFPSITEWLFSVWVASLAALVFVAALQLLPIITQRKEVSLP